MRTSLILTRRHVIHAGALGVIASAVPGRISAAEPATKTLADDVAILRSALTTLHPGLYRYLQDGDVEAGLAKLSQSYVNAPDQAARYLALSRFLATLRCGHSYANFYNQSEAVRADLFDRKTRLPFAFRWLGDAMIITADHGSGAALMPGSAVLAVNGVRASTILARLMPYVRADGHNDAKRRSLLSVTGGDKFETFDIFHGLVFGPPRGGQHEVELRTPEGKTKRVTVPAITLADRQTFTASRAVAADQPLWQWHERANGVAVLTMDDWGTYRTKWDWKQWLDDKLNTLSSTGGLIVDIRKNEGGEDCGNEIIARFAAHDVLIGAERSLVRFRTTPAALNPYLDTWEDQFRSLGADAERYDDRFLRLKRSDGGRAIIARGPQIKVPMIILTSAQNSSATFQFATRCRSAGLATLIGEPTGGNQRGINGGAFFFVRLPASGLEFDLPLIGTFPVAPAPDAGLIPDVTVRPTALDIATGRDAAMEAAIGRLGRAGVVPRN